MDFRGRISARQIEAARRLMFRGILSYQPYIFSDDLAVGAGFSIVAGFTESPPAIYCPDAGASDADPVFLSREVAKDGQRDAFFAANDAMRGFYEDMIDHVTAEIGDISQMTVADVGCNSGYFPLSFARRGARKVKALDRVDYGPTIELLNEICGTSVEFGLWSYDGSIKAREQFDLVVSTAVLCHLSDPLHHLAWLGSSARKALMVFTPCHNDDDHSIRFHAVNRYYSGDDFPYCFDMTTISKKLLRLSLERMGFTRIIELDAASRWMSPGWAASHLGLLGIRESEAKIDTTRPLIPLDD